MKVQFSGPHYDDVSRRRAYVEALLDKARQSLASRQRVSPLTGTSGARLSSKVRPCFLTRK
jgi:hypothetical protein